MCDFFQKKGAAQSGKRFADFRGSSRLQAFSCDPFRLKYVLQNNVNLNSFSDLGLCVENRVALFSCICPRMSQTGVLATCPVFVADAQESRT